MDCDKIRELLWDFDDAEGDELAEMIRHIESCESCARDFRAIKEMKNIRLASGHSVADRVMEKVREDVKRKNIFKITRYAAAACLVLVVCTFFFLKGFDKKTENDTALSEDVTVVLQNTHADEERFEVLSDPVKTETAKDLSEEENFTQVKDDALPESVFDDVMTSPPEADEQMKLNFYKDDLSLSSHSADIVVSGRDISGALELLAELGAVQTERHIEISGDFSAQVEKILCDGGFQVLYTTSSETPRKTLVFFSDFID